MSKYYENPPADYEVPAALLGSDEKFARLMEEADKMCIRDRTEAAVQGVADGQAEYRPDFAPGRAAPQKGAEP